MFSNVYHSLSRIITTLVTTVLAVVRALWWVVRLIARIILAVARPAMQYLAFLCFIVAAIALVADLTPFLSGDRDAALTSLSQHWNAISPRTLAATQSTVTTATGPWLWDLLNTLILNLPTFLLFAILGALTAYAGRRRKSLEVFVN